MLEYKQNRKTLCDRFITKILTPLRLRASENLLPECVKIMNLEKPQRFYNFLKTFHNINGKVQILFTDFTLKIYDSLKVNQNQMMVIIIDHNYLKFILNWKCIKN